MTIEELVASRYDSFSRTEEEIWGFISGQKGECASMTLAELAAACHVSSMTLQRFTQKLGLSGYSEFKFRLERDLDENQPFDRTAMDGTRWNYLKSMEDIRQKDCTYIFDAMDQARRIFVYGTGELQKNAAREMKRVFLYGKVLVHFIECVGIDEKEMAGKLLGEGDMIFIISQSGNTPGLKEFAGMLRERRVMVVSLTEMGTNDLALCADDRLYITTTYYSIGRQKKKYASGAAFFLAIDTLFYKYMEHRFVKYGE